jgi:hypothetical protein
MRVHVCRDCLRLRTQHTERVDGFFTYNSQFHTFEMVTYSMDGVGCWILSSSRWPLASQLAEPGPTRTT